MSFATLKIATPNRTAAKTTPTVPSAAAAPTSPTAILRQPAEPIPVTEEDNRLTPAGTAPSEQQQQHIALTAPGVPAEIPLPLSGQPPYDDISEMDALRQQIASLHEAIQYLSQQFDVVHHRLDDIDERIDERFGSIHERLENIEQHLGIAPGGGYLFDDENEGAPYAGVE